MNGAARLAAFATAVALVSGGAAIAGGAIDPKGADKPTTHAGSISQPGADPMKNSSHTSAHAAPAEGGQDAVRGLAVADGGLRVEIADPDLRRGRADRIAYRIVDGEGAPVRDFDVQHEKRMHLIVVRRDLTGFQHLHPEMDRNGNWSAPVRLEEPGSYRLFADFARDGESQTLAGDLRVDGDAELRDLPASEPLARTDSGYEVRLEGSDAHAGEEADLRFAVTRDGTTVHVEPYLGANGHLVALREGDLAFLHVHPTEDGHGEAADRHDDGIGFAATFPTTGRYRLFLQFKHEGRVHTAAFTQEVR